MGQVKKIETEKGQTNAKRRVAAYARVSTDTAEQLISLKVQKEHYEEYIRSRPDWEFVGVYYDEGITGTSMAKRDGLLRLLADCDRGLVDYIIVKSISRFSRNTLESIETIRKLSDKGVYLYFEKENIDTGRMESELLLSILSSLAESESRSISENSKWAIQKRIINGTMKLGYMPFGYVKQDGKMVIDEEEAEHVRWIFKQTLSGVSSADIANELNRKGVVTKRGEKWKAGVVRGIIKNEKYIGDVLFGKTYSDSNFKRHRNHGEREMYYVENHHDAIVSKEVFEGANRILENNRKEKNINPDGNANLNRYALSGKIICDECGSKWKRSHQNGRAFYVCGKHVKDRTACSMKGILESSIHAAFMTMMNKLTFAREAVLYPLDEGLSVYGGEDAIIRISEIQDDMERITLRKQQVTGFFSKGLLDPAIYQEEMDRLSADEKQLIKERDLRSNSISTDYDRTQALASLLKYTAKGNMVTEYDEELVEEHVDRIIVYSREEIGFVMKCGPTFREKVKPL